MGSNACNISLENHPQRGGRTLSVELDQRTALGVDHYLKRGGGCPKKVLFSLKVRSLLPWRHDSWENMFTSNARLGSGRMIVNVNAQEYTTDF
jgi:hypothetical protein